METLKKYKNSILSQIPLDDLKCIFKLDFYEVKRYLKRHPESSNLLNELEGLKNTYRLCQNCNDFFKTQKNLAFVINQNAENLKKKEI